MIEIVPLKGLAFYDYEAKYLSEGSVPVIPAKLTKSETKKIRRMAVEAFKACDLAGLARVDFLMEPGGKRRRRVDLVGGDGRLVVGDVPVDRAIQSPALRRDEDRVVPRFLELGEGVLNRADVGDEFEGFGGEVAQQVAADADEERLARGEIDAEEYKRLRDLIDRTPADAASR